MTTKTQNILGGSILLLSALLVLSYFLPGLLTTRTAVRETAAFRTLLALHEAEKQFRDQSEGHRYGTIEELGAAGLIDAELSQGRGGGYRFEVVLQAGGYEAHATPEVYGYFWPGTTGKRSFFVNEERLATSADKKGARAEAADESILP